MAGRCDGVFHRASGNIFGNDLSGDDFLGSLGRLGDSRDCMHTGVGTSWAVRDFRPTACDGRDVGLVDD